MLVAAWIRPEWRRGVRIAARLLGLTLILALTMFLPSAAIDASGFPLVDSPNTDFLTGTYRALFGTVLLIMALRRCRRHHSSRYHPRPPRFSHHPMPRRSEPGRPHRPPRSRHRHPATVGQPGPARVPRWRQPWPVTGVVVGTLAVATLEIEGAVQSAITGAGLPDVPGAEAFSGEERGRAEVSAVAHRDEVVVLVSATGGPADINATVNGLIRAQYDRL